MRVAEQELEADDSNSLAVFVSFNISSLISTNDPLQFYHWMLAKTLKALINKLRKAGHLISPDSAGLLSNDGFSDDEEVEQDLKRIVKSFENSYRNQSTVDVGTLPDIEDAKEAIESICRGNGINRIYFFFDEAAHVFRPEQQRQFFSLFKDLRSPYITCNAAIYPGVTYFGESFEPIHDCLYRKLERNVKDSGYISYFKEIALKQATDEMRAQIDRHGELFATMAFSCGGNPRMLLKTLQDIPKFTSNSANQVLKEFYRAQIWAEHTELGEKYNGHKALIDWGRDFLEKQVIPSLVNYNTVRSDKGANESSIYFWIHKDSPETVKEALRLLTYTGIIRKIDSSMRAARSELGAKYEVKYGCMLALFNNPHPDSTSFYASISTNRFIQFGRNHTSYSAIANLSNTIEDDSQFRKAVESMLRQPISVLRLLTPWQRSRLEDAGINTIEDLYNKTEEDLIAQIYSVGPARARIMKNSATAELLEYLSG
ncbi:MAG: hypothetical protein EON54_05980 [Alcaligenaceae bacterium]|nr:MAG: hypothetical protein EON54_05980 [Alcaligenaceae bacterium]